MEEHHPSGAGLPFWKYHGTGNDFVMLDNRDGQLPSDVTSGLVRRLCDRHLGVGGDGLIVLERTGSELSETGSVSSDDGYDFRMQYFNSDGSVGALCGNGARCAVAFAVELGIHPSRSGHWRFVDGNQRVLDGFLTGSPATKGLTQIAVRMPDVNRIQIVGTSGYFVDTGCPHLVLYVENEAALDQMDVSTSGCAWRHDDLFRATGGTNVDFVCQPRADDSHLEVTEVTEVTEVIRVRTFERGVEAETLSCGTGAVAAAIVDLYRKFIATPEEDAVGNVTSCDVSLYRGDGDVVINSNNDVVDSSRKCDVTPNGYVMRVQTARAADVIGAEGDATSISCDVIAHSADVSDVGRDVTQDVICPHFLAVPLSVGVGREGRYERYVEARGGRLTVRVDCLRDRATGNLVFRNILLSGPVTKVFCGRFFQ